MKKFLGIIGGVGSLASAYFYEMLVKKTDVSCDQEHINMVILNHSTIPDRTAYILDESEENPLPFFEEDVKLLSQLGAELIFIPCNTSHYFYDDLTKVSNVPILNMIEDTVDYIKEKGYKKVLILATSGTIKSELYQKACERIGVDYVVPSDATIKKVMNVIYDGVKSGKAVNYDDWKDIIDDYTDVDGYILGCTELSVLKRDLALSSEYIDPLEVEAGKIIKHFGKKEKVD